MGRMKGHSNYHILLGESRRTLAKMVVTKQTALDKVKNNNKELRAENRILRSVLNSVMLRYPQINISRLITEMCGEKEESSTD